MSEFIFVPTISTTARPKLSEIIKANYNRSFVELKKSPSRPPFFLELLPQKPRPWQVDSYSIKGEVSVNLKKTNLL